jgi:hypothetical protein
VPDSPRYDGWPTDARALIEQAMTAHGGRSNWQSVRSIKLVFGAASGVLPRFKGYTQTFGAPREFEVRPHERQTIFHAYPDAEHRGWFLNGDVMIEHVASRQPVSQSRDHRRTFSGREKSRQWSPLDALYFFGYALWHYHTLPFTLGSAQFVSLRQRASLAALDVVFPAGTHTHSLRQRFFFDQDGLIVRHDYIAEIVGIWAMACHFWDDFDRAGGLLIARRRRVFFRLLGHPTPLEVLRVEFSGVSAQPAT